MMRVQAATSMLLGLALALTCTKANAQHPPSLMEVRTAYRAACLAPANSEVVTAFNRTAEHWVGSDSTNAFAQGLLATARMMRAETQFNPLAKLQTFLAQRDPLEAAIAAAPNKAAQDVTDSLQITSKEGQEVALPAKCGSTLQLVFAVGTVVDEIYVAVSTVRQPRDWRDSDLRAHLYRRLHLRIIHKDLLLRIHPIAPG